MISIELTRKNKIIMATIVILFIIFIFFMVSLFRKHSSTKVVKNDYVPKVLVIYKQGTNNYLDAFQNYNQSYVLNTQVKAVDDNDILKTSLSAYDLVCPDDSLLTSPNIDKIKPILTSYVSSGGCLFLDGEWYKQLPQDLTGVAASLQYIGNSYGFDYPKVDYNLGQLQLVIKDFLSNFEQYRKQDFPKLKINILSLVDAQPIATIDNSPIMSFNRYNKGCVFMCGMFPTSNYITGFDMTAKSSDQPYFDFSLATINYFVRNEVLAFSLKESQGFVLKKVFGSYGRPAMAWQNHFGGLAAIKEKDMIRWTDTLKDYNQIPSFSLIRSTYDWGQWKSDIAVHINKGTNSAPDFVGEEADSHYSSGQTLTGNADYITFGDYPDYKNLNDPIEKPNRAYPTVVDYDADGDKDLVVGAPDGKLYLVRNTGDAKNPSFNDKEDLNLSVVGCAAPTAYDINKDGLFDLLVGNSSGNVSVLINHGSKGSPSFDPPYNLPSVSGPGPVAPAFGDVDGDGADELILGTASGSVLLFKNSPKGFINKGEIINKKDDKFMAPAVYDWNNDGKKDILVGNNSGTVEVFINNNGSFSYLGNIAGETYNPQGNKSLIGGHNSVPVVTDWNGDGNFDLLMGQLEFGVPYDIDSPLFKYKNELKDALDYVVSNGIPVYPNFLTHRYKTSEQESAELALQKKSFESYGLKWGNHGTDQHTWETSNLGPAQTLVSAMNAGAWWDFGFSPPNEDSSPRDSKEYIWSTPFLLGSNTDAFNFIAFSPAPNLSNYSKVYDSFEALDMPITYFEHIEYKISNSSGLNSLKEMATFLNKVRAAGEYNFMTQEQMAKCFINTFKSKANVAFGKNGFELSSDTSGVPDLVGEYKGTLGLKFERGEKYKNATVNTTSNIYYYDSKTKDLYFGIGSGVKITFDKLSSANRFHIVRSNVPFKSSSSKTSTKIEFMSPGMQEIRLYSPSKLQITGENIKVVNDDKSYYTVTHYGKPITITVK